MKKIFTLFFAILCFTNASAYDFKVNGIFYSYDSEKKNAIVVAGDNPYSGNITIPVVSIAASPSTLYITDYHAMLQLPVETESTYWREVPSMQGMRSAPIVAN